MSKESSYEEYKPSDVSNGGLWLPIIETKNNGMFVLISHEGLNHLVGNLLQMCDLTGDTEQRQAMKSEIKQRCRKWLNDEYWNAGYDPLSPTGMRDGYKSYKLK